MTSRPISRASASALRSYTTIPAGPDTWRLDGDGSGGLLLVWSEPSLGPMPTDADIATGALDAARTARRAAMIVCRDRDLRGWIVGDVTGQIYLYDVGPSKRADYIGLPGMLDAADAADPDAAPHASPITVRDPDTGAELQVGHNGAQVRGLLQIGMGYLVAVSNKYHARLAAIDAAADLAALAAITWE